MRAYVFVFVALGQYEEQTLVNLNRAFTLRTREQRRLQSVERRLSLRTHSGCRKE